MTSQLLVNQNERIDLILSGIVDPKWINQSGQINSSKVANLQFAMYLMSVAEEYCPWLFLDIYYAKGHYNQALTNKGLLFEMGTYLGEKELVLETVPQLANVIDKTLFSR